MAWSVPSKRIRVMCLITATVIFILFLRATAFSSPPQQMIRVDDPICPSAFIIGCRGTMERSAYGALKPLIKEIISEVEGAKGIPLLYPALGIKSDGTSKPVEYIRSEFTGVNNLNTVLDKFYARCPTTPIALLGYSQGAHVIGDILCGKTQPEISEPIDHEGVGANIKAIISFGDPSNRREVSWHVGTATRDGLLARVDLEHCQHYADRWKTYCNKGDPFCAFDMNDQDVPVHLHYIQEFGQAAGEFVVEKLKAAIG